MAETICGQNLPTLKAPEPLLANPTGLLQKTNSCQVQLHQLELLGEGSYAEVKPKQRARLNDAVCFAWA